MSDQPPPYPKHEKAIDRLTPAERLQSLQEYAEQQKYVRPGQDGTLNTSGAGIRSLAFGGPMQQSQYKGSLPPPAYPSDQTISSKESKKSFWSRLAAKVTKEK